MVKIFISYRRTDSQYVTDNVYEHMARHFSKENVFLDVGNIPFGVDFRTYLNDQVAAHDVMLVIIGPDWGRIMQERAGQANDFVRIEIESALKQNKLLIPVLVKNAEMPDFSQLPQSISELQWRNSAVVRRQPDLESDCKRLADGIKGYASSVGFPVQPSTKVEATSPASGTKKTIQDILPPPFDWVEITGGSGTMKTNSENVTLQIPTETYWMGKYPVTNAQFAKFIEAGGYTNQKWWTQEGWQECQEGVNYDDLSIPWTQPRFWDDSKWNGADYPVVGVSWFEAVAYCQWLTEALVGTAFLPSGQTIMLPTEAQWQYAAQGTDGRTYPWGDDFDKDRCNTDESDIQKTTPVTRYAGKGDSPFGVVDMVGNVWEWCLTDYDNLTNIVDKEAAQRILRGGSWFYISNYTRATSRKYTPPYKCDFSSGFRLVRAPSR